MNSNKHSFYKNTFCDFIEVNEKEIVNLQGNFTSKKGSSYFFTHKGVYRRSNHWGRVGNCRWRLRTINEKCNQINRIGFAKWSDFFVNNETDDLFYLDYDATTNTITYQHKKNLNYNGKAVLRNANKTTLVIRQINELLNTNNWARYYDINDIDTLRKNWIEKLVTTNVSLQELKRKLLQQK